MYEYHTEAEVVVAPIAVFRDLTEIRYYYRKVVPSFTTYSNAYSTLTSITRCERRHLGTISY